jgi:hypothetical protein
MVRGMTAGGLMRVCSGEVVGVEWLIVEDKAAGRVVGEWPLSPSGSRDLCQPLLAGSETVVAKSPVI